MKAVYGSFLSAMLSVLKPILNPMDPHFVRNCLQKVRTCHPKLESIRAATADLVSFLCSHPYIWLFTSVTKFVVCTHVNCLMFTFFH